MDVLVLNISNPYSLNSGGLSEILMLMGLIIHHKGGHWNCAIRIIRILESLTV